MNWLPHDLILAPRIARLWGHDGWTLYFWTFVSTKPVGARFARHERRHVLHWTAGTLGGAVVVLAGVWLFGWSLWLLSLSPLGFLLPYFGAFIPGWIRTRSFKLAYHLNWFERDAERWADRAELL